MGAICRAYKLGLIDYDAAWQLQRRLFEARRCGQTPDVLLLAEHRHVYTIGRRFSPEHLLASPDELGRLGIGLRRIERGGDITYHGPGQLVAYPILDLTMHRKDVNLYLRRLEEVIIRTLADFGILACRKEGYTGVWVNDQKIAAIGVAIRHWITMHGFALNVNTDLSYFDRIIPCGIRNKRVTSMAHQIRTSNPDAGKDPPKMSDVEDRVIHNFGQVFEMEMQLIGHRPLAINDRMAGADII